MRYGIPKTLEQKRAERAKKAVDKVVEQAYYKHCMGTKILISDIPKLYADARFGIANGCDIGLLMPRLVQKYNVPEGADDMMTVEHTQA